MIYYLLGLMILATSNSYVLGIWGHVILRTCEFYLEKCQIY